MSAPADIFAVKMSNLKEKFNALRVSAREAARSANGHNVWLYLLFVLIAFIFWALMSLDNEVQQDFDLPVELEDVPDSLTVIQDFPSTVSVGVKAKGSQLLRFILSTKVPPMKVKFDATAMKNNRLTIGRTKLDARLRDYFGSGVMITSCRPDSLTALLTALPGKRLPLIVQADVSADIQYTISGKVKASTDSVMVYSTENIPASLTAVKTDLLVRSGLKDTTRFEVTVQPVPGMKIVPDVVTVTVPVEPLIANKRFIKVEMLNVPENTNVILFPSKIEISYLVPMSAYNEEEPMQAYADFNAIGPGVSKLGLFLSTPGGSMRNVSMSTDSVEFVLERL